MIKEQSTNLDSNDWKDIIHAPVDGTPIIIIWRDETGIYQKDIVKWFSALGLWESITDKIRRYTKERVLYFCELPEDPKEKHMCRVGYQHVTKEKKNRFSLWTTNENPMGDPVYVCECYYCPFCGEPADERLKS